MSRPVIVQRKKVHRAFSLIELLFVVIILGIILGLAVPQFRNSFSSLILKDTADSLAHLMRYAQSRAILKNTTHGIFFQDDKRYWLAEESSAAIMPGTFQRVPGNAGRTFDIPEELTMELQAEHINFYPDGTMDRMDVVLHHRKEKYITISTRLQRGIIDVIEGTISDDATKE